MVARDRSEDVSRDRGGDGRRGKTAIVTGGASGIGRALAIRLAADGMKVGVADVHLDRLNELTGLLPHSMGLEVDVSAPEAMEVAARRFIESLGTPHVLCLNAGIGGPTGRRLWELAPSEWERTIGVNLFGVVNGLRSFLPAMIAAGEGHVVITASMSSITSGTVHPCVLRIQASASCRLPTACGARWPATGCRSACPSCCRPRCPPTSGKAATVSQVQAMASRGPAPPLTRAWSRTRSWRPSITDASTFSRTPTARIASRDGIRR